AAQQRVDLVFQIACSQGIGWRYLLLAERGFQFFNLGFLCRREIASSQLETRIRDPLENVSKLAGRALGCRGRIVESVSKAGGKLPQRRQSVTLFYNPSGLTDSV